MKTIDWDRDLFLDDHLGFMHLVVNIGERDLSAFLRRHGYLDIPYMVISPDVSFTGRFSQPLSAVPSIHWNSFHRSYAVTETRNPRGYIPYKRFTPELTHNSLLGTVTKRVRTKSGKHALQQMRLNLYQIYTGSPHSDAENHVFHEAFEAVLESNLAALEIAELFCSAVMKDQ